jgi:hypothetical protein
MNTHVRDNFNETAPGIASATGLFIVTDGANSIVERAPTIDYEPAAETTTSTSYTDLATAGPAVTVTTGTAAIVFATASIRNNTATQNALMGWAVSGATTTAANDAWAAAVGGTSNIFERSTSIWIATLTGGSNTFTAKYKVSGGTGTFDERSIVVIPL